jgi:GNAT superfamily N-acetyltransferase
MSDTDNSSFSMKLIRRNDEEIEMYARLSSSLVLEADKRSITSEVNKIKSRFHIDHCWILRDDEKIGTVKIIRNNFYNLGLPVNMSAEDVDRILLLIEEDIGAFHNYRIEGTIHSKYLQIALDRSYQILFSRKKMELKFENFRNGMNYEDINIQSFSKKSLEDLTQVFIDAYTDSIDEKVGMFDRTIAHSAVRSIMEGEFGEFQPTLSGSVYTNSGDEMIGGVLITLLEESPFVVIIGVKRNYQSTKMGRKLMTWCIEKSIQNGHDKMKLWVTNENIIATGLYDSLGFREVL